MNATHRDTTERLAASNAACLRQGLALLARLSDEQYACARPPFERGGIGAHIRHVVDHYDALLAGVATGSVDYDLRERDRRVERERGLARARLEHVLAQLLALPAGAHERVLAVHMDDGGRRAGPPAQSSVGRELQFLLSHTVHHYALIAAKARGAGLDPGRDFGVAPATLRHEQSGPCAR